MSFERSWTCFIMLNFKRSLSWKFNLKVTVRPARSRTAASRQVKTLHKSSLFLTIFLPSRTLGKMSVEVVTFQTQTTLQTWCARGTLSVHPRCFHDLDHLKPEGWDIVLDLVDIVLSDALVLRLPLLLSDVSPHQVPHDRLILEISLPCLTLLSLKYKICKNY